MDVFAILQHARNINEPKSDIKIGLELIEFREEQWANRMKVVANRNRSILYWVSGPLVITK